MSTLRDTYSLTFRTLKRADKLKLAFYTICQILLTALDLIGVLLLGFLGTLSITGIQSNTPTGKIDSLLKILKLDDNTFQYQVAWIAAFAAALLVVKTVFSLIVTKKSLTFLSEKSSELSIQLFTGFINQPLNLLEKETTQRSLYAVTDGVSRVVFGLIASIMSLVSDISLLLILTAALFFVNPITALVTFTFFSFVAVILHFVIARKAGNLAAEMAETSVSLNQNILETIDFYRELIVRNSRESYLKKITQIRQHVATIESEINFYPNINKYIMDLIIVIGVLVISASLFLLKDAQESAAGVVIFLVAGTRMGPAVLRIQQTFVTISSNSGSAKPTLDLMLELNRSGTQENQKLPRLDGSNFVPSIDIQNLCFKYSDSSGFALEDITFRIEPGKFVAIVGSSGAGKSTLVDLMLGMYSPLSGVISISNCGVPEVFEQFPGLIAYAPQQIQISSESISHNIKLGFETSDTELKISNLLKIVGMLETINELPKGQDSTIGENGNQFSGGQKQRIGIARALFTDPRMLILDEATSSLDATSEALITETIKSLKGKVTVVMIAHRLSTIKDADLVLFLDKGKLTASGTFEEVKKLAPDFAIQAQLLGL